MIKIIQTNHFVNQEVTNNFSKGCGGQKISVDKYSFNQNDTIATYGILRGTEIILKKAENYYYIDHGYFESSKRKFEKTGTTSIENLSGYFRIVKNDLIHDGSGNYDEIRLKKLKINFKEIRKKGDFIIISEPSDFVKNFYNLKNWTQNTIEKLKNKTDRKIFVHNKNSPIPLDRLLQNAWAFVSFHSTGGFKSMINGVPAHFTHKKLQSINSIENIESGQIDYKIFNNLSYGQWTLNEMKSGEAWEKMQK
mgnify:CR=1 FL=1